MRNRTLELLRKCLASGDTEAWLKEHPEHRERVLPYLEMHSILWGVKPPEPSAEGGREGHQQLMAALARPEGQNIGGRTGWLPAPLMKLATVAAALSLFLVVAGGASAALGGGGFVDDVLSSLGFNEKASNGINNASSHAERGRDCANENAFEGHGNSLDRPANANEAAKDDRRCEPVGNAEGHTADEANANAAEGSGNADDGINNASENADNGREHANDNALEGSGNADARSGNASHQNPPAPPTPPAGPR